MAKGKSPRRKRSASAAPTESQAAEALTIAWALAVVTVFFCDVGAALARLYAINTPKASTAGLLAGLLFFAAVMIGLIVLILLPLVYRVRREPPPLGFTVFAVVVALAPVGVMALQIVTR